MHNLQPCEPQIQANLKECKYEPFALPSQKHANARLHFHIANMRMRVYTAAPQAFMFRIFTAPSRIKANRAFALPSQSHANTHLHFHIANMRMRVYTAAPQAFEFCPPSRSGKALFFKD